MPILNRFAKPPRAWPPPRTPEEVGDCLRFAEERDPVGTSVHLVLAMLFCASIALSTAMTSVSFVLLVGYTVLRGPNLWRAWMPLLPAPVTWWWIASLVWMVAARGWSLDAWRWGDAVSAMACLAIVPALVPLSSRWKALLGAFVVGAAIQGAIQVVQAVLAFGDPLSPAARHAGIGSHPGHVSNTAGMAMLVALAWLREARTRSARIGLVAAMLLCSASLLIGLGRGAIVGFAVGLVVLAWSMAMRFGLPWRSKGFRVGLACVAVAAAAIGALVMSGRGPASVRYQIAEAERTSIDAPSSIGRRLLWWGVSWDAFRESPWIGIGVGSCLEYSSRHPTVLEVSGGEDPVASGTAMSNPHSLYLFVLAEQGLVGVALLGGIVWSTLAAAWRSSFARPAACGTLAAIVMWFGAAAFDTLTLPLRTSGPLMLFTAIILLPGRAGIGLPARDPSSSD